MAHILFVVDIPTDDSGVQFARSANPTRDWMKFEGNTKTMPLPSPSSKQLARNAWLLDAKSALPFLVELSVQARTCGLPYLAHLIEGDLTALT